MNRASTILLARVAVAASCLWFTLPNLGCSPDSRKKPNVDLAAGKAPEPAKPGGDDPQNSDMDGHTYTNHFFGFSYTYPKDWRLISAPITSAGGRSNDSLGFGRAYAFDQGLQTAERKVFSLFIAAEGSLAVTPSNMQHIRILAIKLRDPNISLKDQLKLGTTYLKAKGSRLQMAGEPTSVTFGGREFWKQRMTQQENGFLLRHVVLATKKKGYVVQFVFSALTDAGTDELEAMLPSSLKFQP